MKFKSKKNQVYFIAEVGSNHEGNFNDAKKIIKNCIKSTADCIKIQIYTAKNMVSKKDSNERYNHFSKLKLNIDDYLSLAKLVCKSGKDFSASIWDKELIKPFNRYLKFYKIGSGDITNYEIIDEITKTGKPILISTGLSTIRDIKNTLNFISNNNKKYKSKQMISLLHCNTAYPTPIENSNLLTIKKLQKIFKRTIGYSDHTIGNFVPLMAYIYGAKIIEKHYSINPKKKSFRDHQISINKNEVNTLLKNINSIKEVNKFKDKQVTRSEKLQNNLRIFRRSIYLKKDIKINEKICKDKIISLRPFRGICGSKYFKIIGKKVKKNLKKGDALYHHDLF